MGVESALQFNIGKVICGRWKVVSRLGAGGCGSVYKVEDLKANKSTAALKAEPILEDESGVLKLEAAVLRKLADRKNVIRLIHSGKRECYTFIVITLCGSDLISLRKLATEFSESTILRIGIFTLHAVKQLHEIGYVHRDVKPGNMMIGANGRDRRIIYLIDYGMVRSFIVRTKNGGLAVRKPRKKVLLRGTLRYCSLNVHRRLDQGRVDDLWAMIYMLCELYIGLPWNRISVEKEVMKMKETETDESVFRDCPDEFVSIARYLRTLSYQDRPDYHKIYNWYTGAMKREKYTFAEKYDWETAGLSAETQFDLDVDTKKADDFEKEASRFGNIEERNFAEVLLSV